MIFARGVRFIRFMSSSVRGRLSGSLRAAACFSASVIASRRLQSCFGGVVFLAVLFMISASLMWFCFTCRDNSHFISSQRERDDQQAADLTALLGFLLFRNNGKLFQEKVTQKRICRERRFNLRHILQIIFDGRGEGYARGVEFSQLILPHHPCIV